jgi:conjugative relaxase-like TrwC/TraI family protein
MLTITVIRAPERASDHFATAHRYGGEARPAAAWFGVGAAAKGLIGPVDSVRREELLDGRLDGQTRLGRRRGGERQHLHGWDLTFSAPKSVSFTACVGGDERLVAAHDAAVRQALGWLQDNALVTRLRNRGKPQHYPTRCLLAAIVRHEISRAAEPHLHSRALVVNATLAATDTWRSIVSRPLYLNAKPAGIRYQQALAGSAEALGYAIAWNDNGTFELGGIPRALTSLFSGRAKAVEQHLVERGRSRATASIAQRERATRQAAAVRSPLPREQQRQRDRTRARQAGFDLEGFVDRARQAARSTLAHQPPPATCAITSRPPSPPATTLTGGL